VTYAETPGVEGPADQRQRRRRRDRQRRTARGGLMYRHAAGLGGARGALWLARWGALPLAGAALRGVSRDRSRARHAVRSTRAWVHGCRIAAGLPALREPERRGPADATPFDRSG
jgi:hypothetical protein